MIGKFISGLNDIQKKLVALGLGVLVIFLFYILLVNPTMSKLSSIDQDISKEEVGIEQDLAFLKSKDKVLKESKVLESYLTADAPAEEEIIAAFLKKIEGLAKKANVAIIKVTPSPGQQEKAYLKYQAELECSGKLTDVISFMHLVNTSDDLLKVIKFNLGAKKSDTEDSIKATLSVTKIIVSTRTPAAKPAPSDSKSVVPADKVSAASE